ncbi:MAG: hypothetical protein HWQ35_16655 [Nostoc sp. NMS1]|uniref:hypothetical protein n=1 Tax=unclassified Nostoc TaxID=2593658 RepID=UPI0025CE6B47|nr:MULTISPECIES: hypothetical protein [unclassified Nostoc]MBN3908112.1 hypothetical protein [Nostoc sp. NMS1]MBN3989022.1 hypothetical protein [Nostoc sp. NMS2]
MNTKQLILKSAIGVFAFSTILSGCVMLFGQKKPNYFNITIPASAARLAFCFSMMGTGLTMFIGSRIETAQFEESLKPRPVPTPCQGCKHFHGVVYNGVTLNCAVHPKGWQGDKCPDWQSFQLSK